MRRRLNWSRQNLPDSRLERMSIKRFGQERQIDILANDFGYVFT